ncbi:UPF0236 family transposase-like protein, partial [Streptococcus sp. zg-JUN1979]|uniref:UPF0236 family transposase-like protein n=1 Tax=Streptococcus sp. zg-JUN1979 TaxID=3391450 RepID=UPI0039B09E4F
VLKAVKRVDSLLDDKKRYRFFKTEAPHQKIKADVIYIEGDGVRVKTTSGDERSNTDLAHFLVHTGSKRIAPNRFILENKYEIIDVDYELARDNLLDYLYNHFQITDKTVLISNSDNGAGYTKQVFTNIKKALGIKRHEHFWDLYHVNDLIKTTLRPYSPELRNSFFKAIKEHDLGLLKTSLDTFESLMDSEEELERFLIFKRRLMRGFKDTKP